MAKKSYRGSGKLAGKKAVITGGDSGIGRAVAIAYAREGADVLISDLNEHEDAEETRRACGRIGRKAVLVAGDIGSSAHCRAIVDKAVSELGGIDILVNNAAHQATFELIEDISEEEWELTFRVNIHEMFYLTKAAVPHMKEGNAIINTASINADKPNPTLLAYATDKGRHSELHGGPRPTACREGYPRQCGRPRSDLDAAYSLDDVRRHSRRVRQERADETPRTTGRPCDRLRDAGRSALKLCVGRDNRGDRRKANSLGHYQALKPIWPRLRLAKKSRTAALNGGLSRSFPGRRFAERSGASLCRI